MSAEHTPHISQLAATIQDGIDSDSGEYSVQDAAEVALRSLLEQFEALREAALAYLSVPSGPGDWSVEESVARQALSIAARASNPASRSS